MAEEQQNQATQTDAKEQTQAAASAETKNTDTESQEIMIPKHRYDEISKKLKALEDEQAKAAKQREDEDSKKLAEQQEWQKLADKRKTQVEELTPKAELADKLTELVAAEYEARTKDWPEEVRALAPGDDASITQKWDWMVRATPLARAQMDDKTPTPGNGRRPSPIAPASQAKAVEAQRNNWSQQARARYR